MTRHTATHQYTCSKVIPWTADNQGERVRLAIDDTTLVVITPGGESRYLRRCANLGEAYKVYLSLDGVDPDILENNEFWQVPR